MLCDIVIMSLYLAKSERLQTDTQALPKRLPAGTGRRCRGGADAPCSAHRHVATHARYQLEAVVKLMSALTEKGHDDLLSGTVDSLADEDGSALIVYADSSEDVTERSLCGIIAALQLYTKQLPYS